MLTESKAVRLPAGQQRPQLAELPDQQVPGGSGADASASEDVSTATDQSTAESGFAQMSIAELLQLDLVLPEGAEAGSDTLPATDGSIDLMELSLLELMDVRAVPAELPELPDLAPPDTVIQLPDDDLNQAPPSHLFPEGGLIPIGVLPGTDSTPLPPPPPPPPDPTVNVAPDARNDSYTVLEDALLTRTSVNGVLLNDVDGNGDKLTVSLISGPANGKLVLNSNGSFTYDSNANFNGKDSFIYQVNDGRGGIDMATVFINVTPVNDAPTIVAGSTTTTGSATELSDGDVDENGITHKATGTIAFADVDLPNTHSASIVPQGSGYLGSLVLGTVDQIGDTVDWNFSVADSALDVLADGEVRSQTYNIIINDKSGGTVTQAVTITLTGANDAPTILGGTTATGSVTEISDKAIGENTTTSAEAGTIFFDDVDSTDTHSASVAPQSGGYLGSFALGTINQVTDRVGWTFSVDDAELDFLGAAEVLTQSYDVTIDDGHGGTATQVITITLTGTNDAPSAAAFASGGVVDENSADGTVVGTVLADDPDLGDSITYSLSDDAGGRFTIDPTTGIISVANGSLLDFETDSSHSITVETSDGLATTSSKLTITVNNVVEPLFTAGDDTVDFNSVADGEYTAGTEHDALGGDDNVILPIDSSAATVAGYDPLTPFSAGNGDDTVTGGDLDDLIAGGSGADSLSGGGGNDVFEWDSGDAAIDGGGDTDTLYTDVGDIDLTTTGVSIADIEIVDLGADVGSNTLTLTAADVLAITDSSHVLTVSGDNKDSVEAGTGWSGGLPDVNGDVVYTQLVGATMVTLIVDPAISVNADILT